MRNLLSTILLSMIGFFALHAQGEDFDPSNPPDPSGEFWYKITVTAEPAGYASGSGRYLPGTDITISTSPADEYYVFKHWLKDGVVHSYNQNFEYTTEAKSVKFVAVYDYVFDPTNPEDPNANYQFTLTLTTNQPDACSFNWPGKSRHSSGEPVMISCYPSPDYPFLGWFDGNQLLTKETSFDYTMPSSSITLEARFGNFDPLNPDDPTSAEDQEDIQNYLTGDVNEDGDVDIADVAALYSLIKNDEYTTSGDVNNDNDVDIADVAAVYTIIKNQ